MRHNCRITRVVDGDTFKGVVDLDFGVSLQITIRLNGCDVFETRGKEKCQEGIEAKEYIESLIGGTIVMVEPLKQDSFGRWLCDIWVKEKSLKSILAEKNFLTINKSDKK